MLDGHGVIGLVERPLGDAEFLRERGLHALVCGLVGRIGGDQRIAVDVNFLEHRAVQLVEFAEAFQGVVTAAPGSGARRSTVTGTREKVT